MRPGLMIVGDPSAKLRDAFARVANLHSAFDAHPKSLKGKSESHCIFSAHTAAMAFEKMGLSAMPAPCLLMCYTRNDRGAVDTHRIGSMNGEPFPGMRDDQWNGHMVVLVEDYLFDPTFWQIDKTRTLPMMIALPISRMPLNKAFSLARYRGLVVNHPYDILWVDTPDNTAYRSRYDNSFQRLSGDVSDAVIGDLRQHVG